MTSTYIEKNGWNEWAKYVLKSLEELKAQYTTMDNSIEANKETFIKAIAKLELSMTSHMADLSSEINVIKTKLSVRASMWGALAGILSAFATALVMYLTKLT